MALLLALTAGWIAGLFTLDSEFKTEFKKYYSPEAIAKRIENRLKDSVKTINVGDEDHNVEMEIK